MNLAAELEQVERLPLAGLRDRWRVLVGTPAPQVSTATLRLALAWEMQAKALGGLPRATTQALDQLARGRTKTEASRPGMRLVREWAGRAHVVTVDEAPGGRSQIIRWDGREWGSLSEVARAITGTRWSGPAFFGLKKRVAA